MKDKIDPDLQPLYDALEDMIPAVKLQDMMEKHNKPNIPEDQKVLKLQATNQQWKLMLAL